MWDEAELAWVEADAAQRRARLESMRDRDVPSEPAATMVIDFRGTSDGYGTWERLSRYEQRLQQNLARAMRELRAYRKDKRDLGPAEPVDDDDDDIDTAALFDEAQNEPTEDHTAASDEAAGGCERPACDTGVPPERVTDETGTAETAGSQTEGQSDAQSARESSD